MSDPERLKRDETAPPLERLRDALRRDHKADAARALADHVGGRGETNEHIEAIRSAIGAAPKPPTVERGITVHTIKEVTPAQYDRITDALACLEFEWKHREGLGRVEVNKPHVVRFVHGAMTESAAKVLKRTEAEADEWFSVRPLPRDGVCYRMLRQDAVEAAVFEMKGADIWDAVVEAFEYTPTKSERETAYLQTVVAEMRRTGKAVSDERMAEIRATVELGEPPAVEQPPAVEWDVRQDVMEATPPGARIWAEWDRERMVRVNVRETEGAHIADVTVHVPSACDLGDEARQIAQALYWSWWRAQRMKGLL